MRARHYSVPVTPSTMPEDDAYESVRAKRGLMRIPATAQNDSMADQQSKKEHDVFLRQT
jgi:hypothetical protein